MKKISKLVYFHEDDMNLLNDLEKYSGSSNLNRTIKKLLRMGLIMSQSGYDINDRGILLKVVSSENINIQQISKEEIKDTNIIKQNNENYNSEINRKSVSHLA